MIAVTHFPFGQRGQAYRIDKIRIIRVGIREIITQRGGYRACGIVRIKPRIPHKSIQPPEYSHFRKVILRGKVNRPRNVHAVGMPPAFNQHKNSRDRRSRKYGYDNENDNQFV
jgi:hypothetical protein